MQTQSKTLTGGLELTVVKFLAMRGYEMFGRMQADGARTDPKFLRDMLANASVVRQNAKGEPVSIALAGDSKQIDLAFAGAPLTALLEALAFSIEVNFGDFLDAARATPDAPAPQE